MGVVFRAQHVRTGGTVAIKFLFVHLLAEASLQRRFRDEASIVSALHHSNVVQVYDYEEDEFGNPYIVMELLTGEDLAQRLSRDKLLTLPQVFNIAEQVGSALTAAHALGVIHRDIKPQNIFLVPHQLPTGQREIVKVLDFGISKIPRDTQLTPHATVMGTPHYISPEAALGRTGEIREASDQFSLAVVLYRALCGRLPFDADEMVATLYQVVTEQPPPLTSLVPGLPPSVAHTIERAMSKRPQDRFPSVAEFVRALAAGVAEQERPVSLPKPSHPMLTADAQSATVPGREGLPPRNEGAARRLSLPLAALALAAVAGGLAAYRFGGLAGPKRQAEPPPTVSLHKSSVADMAASAATPEYRAESAKPPPPPRPAVPTPKSAAEHGRRLGAETSPRAGRPGLAKPSAKSMTPTPSVAPPAETPAQQSEFDGLL